jgi:hypothetical protein
MNEQNKESSWEKLQNEKFSDSSVLGKSEEKNNQYRSSSEKERFERQLDRDLSRPSNRGKQSPNLSQSAIRKLISEQTSDWARSIYNQKAGQNYSTNFSSQSSSNNQISVSSGESMPSSTAGATFNNDGYASASSGGGSPNEENPDGPPDNFRYIRVTVCQDGVPREFLFAGKGPL